MILPEMRQGAAHIVRCQLPQFDVPDDGSNQRQDAPVEPDGLRRSAIKAFGKPVVDGPLDRVGALELHAGVPFRLELLELLDDLGPCAPRDLVPPPGLPVRAVAEGDRAVPAALGLVLVNGSFVAPTTPGTGNVTTHRLKVISRLLACLLPDDHDRVPAGL